MPTTPSSPPRLLAAALAAADRGWPVVPVRPRSKIPALHHRDRCPGTGVCADGHRGWPQRATTDPSTLAQWWHRRPYNIGIATGPAALVVLDLDEAHAHGATTPHGLTHGTSVFARLAEEAGQSAPWDTYTVLTPSGGRHLYYHAPAPGTIRSSTGPSGLAPLIDVRAQGGLILAAGSTRRDGDYRRDPTAPQELLPLPEWLADRLTPPPPPPPAQLDLPPGQVDAYVAGVVRRRVAAVHAAEVGTRHSTLLSAAAGLGRFVGAGHLHYDDAWNQLLTAAQAHLGVEDFTLHELETTLRDGLAWGIAHA
ncbi:bifunctional DNA primase/polymerase-like protein [Halopolyspora algeriensis]|uniref:Bifunctional DNA primase/polymerase-like protein n=1 Tax=Halopolyspora algeriensis TaxID=1500506 RepID=A0A368VL73_9ACTN|nr:bifunctional DNA primase/polymerase [Halopolyspora algeriensis]RCW41064.1 bifunctional DNA primase/polymerase-like protein [Halopolyspora algeriensis]TQM53852.1 bifunctional DNA primase/polymerase-like protein [Halopolyspora algeriensis]